MVLPSQQPLPIPSPSLSLCICMCVCLSLCLPLSLLHPFPCPSCLWPPLLPSPSSEFLRAEGQESPALETGTVPCCPLGSWHSRRKHTSSLSPPRMINYLHLQCDPEPRPQPKKSRNQSCLLPRIDSVNRAYLTKPPFWFLVRSDTSLLIHNEKYTFLSISTSVSGHHLEPWTPALHLCIPGTRCSINICQTELNFARDKMCVSSAIFSQTEPRDIFTPHISLVKCFWATKILASSW